MVVFHLFMISFVIPTLGTRTHATYIKQKSDDKEKKTIKNNSIIERTALAFVGKLFPLETCLWFKYEMVCVFFHT